MTALGGCQYQGVRGGAQALVRSVDFQTRGSAADQTEITDNLVLAYALKNKGRPRLKTVR